MKVNEERSQRDEIKRILDRAPWYLRLEARVIYAMLAMGLMCVFSSIALVGITVKYFRGFSDQQVELSRDIIDRATDVERAAREVAARRDVVELEALGVELLDHERAGWKELIARRAERWPALRELSAGDAVSWTSGTARRDGPTRVVRLSVERGGAALVLDARVDAMSATTRGADALQTAGLSLGKVTFSDGAVVARAEAERVVTRAVVVASGAALLISLFTGLLLARQTTRKLSHITDTMRRVSEGDESSRAPVLGQDELAVLAIDLNGMLDRLEEAHARVEYLQRVATWQEMARRLAHEIKNPLTPISLAAQQLDQKCVTADDRSGALLSTSVEIIMDEVETLRRMVTSFSRFAAEPEFERQRLDLVRVVDEFFRAYAQTEVPVRQVIMSSPVWVEGDRQLLRQAVVNLVENASNALIEGGHAEGEITVEVELREGVARLAVQDNGPGFVGISADQIFEPYVTTREEGTGLGLSIVKKIVLDHLGKVGAEARAGGGARVWIELPAAGEPDPSGSDPRAVG